MICLKFIAGIFTILFVFSSCTSSPDNREYLEQDIVSRDERRNQALVSREIVVMSKTVGIIMGGLPRSYWNSLRKTSKNPLDVIYANLVLGEWQLSQDMARMYLTKNPGHIEALRALALSLAMQRKYKLAWLYATLASKGNKKDPLTLNLEALKILNDVNSKTFDYKNSMKIFQIAFGDNKREIAAGLNAGYLKLEVGNIREALQLFRQVSSRCQSCVESLRGLGVASYQAENFYQAENYFKKLLGKSSLDAEALFYLALIYKNGYKNTKKSLYFLDTILSKTQNLSWRRRAETLRKTINQ